MMTRGGRVAYVDLRLPEAQPAGSPAPHPGQTAARMQRRRTWHAEREAPGARVAVSMSKPTTRDRHRVALGMVVCPMISGLFFGLVAALLVFRSGGIGHASAVGALVGGFMFASNAAALCIVQSTARGGAASQAQSRSKDRTEAQAS
jgi:hypothetical protein